MKTQLKTWVFAAFLAAIMIGCGGGGGGGSDTPNTPSTGAVSGTAAAGTAISNTSVAIKDKNGNTRTTTTDANGKYSIDVSGMTAPFLLKVYDNTITLYGVATAVGTANIHQFTDLIIKNWYKVQGSSVETAFNSPGAISVPTVTEINTIEATVREIISTWLQTAGLNPGSFNLISTPFDANGSGFDGVLDVLKVSTTSGNVTITPVDPNTGTEGDPIATVPENTSLSADPLQSAINGINTALSNYASTITSKGQSLTASDLLPYYDINYLNDGLNSSMGAQDSAYYNKGISITSWTVDHVVSADLANAIVTVSIKATYTDSNGLHQNQDVGESCFKRGSDGVWRAYGNQRIAWIQLRSGIRKWIASSTNTESILPLTVYAPQGTVTAVQVFGPSLINNPSTLSSCGSWNETGITWDCFALGDNPVSTAPAVGSVYTFTLTRSGGTVLYKETIRATTTETFNITNPTGHTLADARLGQQLTVNWTLPTTFPIEDIELYGWGNNGHNCGAGGTVTNTTSGTSGTITLPSSCNGSQVAKATIGVFIHGDNGEVSKVYYDFQ